MDAAVAREVLGAARVSRVLGAVAVRLGGEVVGRVLGVAAVREVLGATLLAALRRRAFLRLAPWAEPFKVCGRGVRLAAEASGAGFARCALRVFFKDLRATAACLRLRLAAEASGELARCALRAFFQAFRATAASLRARLASRFASFTRLRARLSSSLAIRTR